MKPTTKQNLNAWQIALVAVLVAGGIGGYLFYRQTDEKISMLESELSVSNSENLRLTTELEIAKTDNINLLDLSKYKQTIIDSFQGQIQSISSTVGTLDKLAKIDKELLRKYSKVYFLSENYVPAKLTQVEPIYIFDAGGTNFLVHGDVWPFLKKLLDDARASGRELLIASAFRSFDTQGSLKSDYNVIYGAGTANQFSAEQGYSEHQLGTSVDFTTKAAAGVFSKFRADPAYQWLLDNAHKYGFVLSYPEGNTYYKFEPWHWRFVGVELADRLHREGKYFYDLDQREIDTYLIKIFDI